MIDIINKVKQCLSPDLLRKEYLEENKTNPMAGHCYIATEAIFHILGGKEYYQPYVARDDDNITHWWLIHKITGDKVDVTQEQYTSIGLEPPYKKGKKATFLTSYPSKRAVIVIERYNKL
jgi:hypothetical protein